MISTEWVTATHSRIFHERVGWVCSFGMLLYKQFTCSISFHCYNSNHQIYRPQHNKSTTDWIFLILSLILNSLDGHYAIAVMSCVVHVCQSRTRIIGLAPLQRPRRHRGTAATDAYWHSASLPPISGIQPPLAFTLPPSQLLCHPHCYSVTLTQTLLPSQILLTYSITSQW